MQFSIATITLAFAALASATSLAAPGFKVVARQNQNRPVPQGACCVANTSLKQDTCTAQDGSQGRCVPGGNNCKLSSSSSHGPESPVLFSHKADLYLN